MHFLRLKLSFLFHVFPSSPVVALQEEILKKTRQSMNKKPHSSIGHCGVSWRFFTLGKPVFTHNSLRHRLLHASGCLKVGIDPHL